MTDQVIDAATARGLHANACAAHALVAWVVTRDPPEHPGKFIARLVTDTPSSYVLMADTLAELRAKLPAGVACSDRQPADPPEVVEIWLPA